MSGVNVTLVTAHVRSHAPKLTPGFQRYDAVLRIRFRKNRVRILPFRKRRFRMPFPSTTEKANDYGKTEK